MIFLHVLNMISDVPSFTGMSKVEILVSLGVVLGMVIVAVVCIFFLLDKFHFDTR